MYNTVMYCNNVLAIIYAMHTRESNDLIE
ncbi:protein of unknown function [Candidatus Nitrosocaldus cavascurensis]|uniref:Uncharacterized protein n=1 Tax=Candidatus Nitrosocaldus cavascurensis TaxID=2058097 RepID=A0A2K5ANW9_9ARCH|nr:protein of unknown function [Candidatus Nitrosocaldus cavascurensis]